MSCRLAHTCPEGDMGPRRKVGGRACPALGQGLFGQLDLQKEVLLSHTIQPVFARPRVPGGGVGLRPRAGERLSNSLSPALRHT